MRPSIRQSAGSSFGYPDTFPLDLTLVPRGISAPKPYPHFAPSYSFVNVVYAI